MPKFLENILQKAAAAKGKKGRAADRYVYGAMNNMGAMRGNQETAKGAKMEEKHESDSHLAKQHADMKKYKGKSTTYDFRRPKRQVVTRYTR
jgi:hypothetical protein